MEKNYQPCGIHSFTNSIKSGQTSGHIAIWNLNERKMAGQMRDAHCGAITGMSCFPSEPILVTSSPDNTIKQVSSFFLVKSGTHCTLH